tara:strand:- start:1989 stop:2279 length:291 start_codon:yes stop_codon:yes gene_type:complete
MSALILGANKASHWQASAVTSERVIVQFLRCGYFGPADITRVDTYTVDRLGEVTTRAKHPLPEYVRRKALALLRQARAADPTIPAAIARSPAQRCG